MFLFAVVSVVAADRPFSFGRYLFCLRRFFLFCFLSFSVFFSAHYFLLCSIFFSFLLPVRPLVGARVLVWFAACSWFRIHSCRPHLCGTWRYPVLICVVSRVSAALCLLCVALFLSGRLVLVRYRFFFFSIFFCLEIPDST